ncbi:MAG: membrane protein insertase YidC [Bacteroidaceae bacterium]|nr:membrane protein insertase YidC [Bacteroidaceae bacterium]
MDKNTVTGFILIALVVIGFTWYGQPSEEERRLMQAKQDSIAAVEKQKQAEAENAKLVQEAEAQPSATDSSALFFSQRQGEEQEIVLKNNKVKVTLSTLGGTIQNAEILGFKSRWHDGDVMLMTRKDAQMTFSLAGKQDNIISSDLFFTPTEQTDSSVTMTAEQDGKQLNISYRLLPNSYMMDISLQVTGMSGLFAPNMKTMDISWTDRIMQQEKGADFENRYSALTYMRQGKGVKKLNETGDDTKQPEETLEWIAFKNQFFSAVLIAPEGFTEAQLTSTQEKEKKSGFLKTYEAEMKTFFDPTGGKPTELQMYLGPNDFHILKDHNNLTAYGSDADLDELVYLGWSFFRFINRWSILYIFDWLKAMGLPMGIVLLLLTIIIKVLVYPTQKKSYISSAKMRVLRPKLDELAKQYPNPDQAMQKQQAQMQLYGQYGVSPMGGCLPALIQMPVWVAMFNFIPNAIDLRGESFLWADDLSAYDDIINWGKDLWLIGDHLSLFCILFTLTNIINTLISMRQQQNQLVGDQAQQMKMMQYMMYFMPVMFFFWFNGYSSGLSYFYFISGLISIITMWYLRYTTDDKKILASLEAYHEQHKNDPKKTSGLQARLEALQKMQQEQQANRRK